MRRAVQEATGLTPSDLRREAATNGLMEDEDHISPTGTEG